MHFSLATILAVAGIVAALPAPAAEPAEIEQRTGVAVVNLRFQGGPAFYDLQIPADGQYYPTSMPTSLHPLRTRLQYFMVLLSALPSH